MRSVNKVILIGNLTRDPEMRQTPNGQYVTTFGIATNRDWVTRDSQRHSLPEYHDLVAWAKLAEICQKYLKKGKLIYVEGYLKTRSWDTPDGIKKFKTEIVVQDMIMLDRRASNDNGEGDYFPEEEQGEPVHSSLVEDTMPAKVPGNASPARSFPPSRAENNRQEEKANAAPSENFPPKKISIDDDLGL